MTNQTQYGKTEKLESGVHFLCKYPVVVGIADTQKKFLPPFNPFSPDSAKWHL